MTSCLFVFAGSGSTARLARCCPIFIIHIGNIFSIYNPSESVDTDLVSIHKHPMPGSFHPKPEVHKLFTLFLKIGLAFFSTLRYDMLALRKSEC